MKTRTLAFVTFTALVLLVAAPALLAAESQTLNGEFVWDRSDEEITGALKAVFEPTGENTWDVTFYFTWEDEDRVWNGTAEGSLGNGTLTGNAVSDDERQTQFEFEGTFAEDGSFAGTHQVIQESGEKRSTGSLTLGG